MVSFALAAIALASPCPAQPAGKSSADAAKALYEQAKQREDEGDLEGAMRRYATLAEDYPSTEWARLAQERTQILVTRVVEGARQSAAPPVAWYLLGIVRWIGGLLVLGLIFGFFGWRAGWFWEWALLARVADSANGAMARWQSRKRLVRELEASKRNPRDAKARHALGVIYYRSRRYAQAAEELAQAVAVDPDRADAQYHLGLVRLRLGQPQEAIGPLERVAAGKPTHGGDAVVRLAEAKLSAGDAPGAEQAARAAIEKMPTDAGARYFLALALDAQGKREEVPGLLEEAVTLGRSAEGIRRREGQAAARRAKTYLRSRVTSPRV
jgi:tetratricopeptide (TPR) repeat protein